MGKQCARSCRFIEERYKSAFEQYEEWLNSFIKTGYRIVSTDVLPITKNDIAGTYAHSAVIGIDAMVILEKEETND